MKTPVAGVQQEFCNKKEDKKFPRWVKQRGEGKRHLKT